MDKASGSVKGPYPTKSRGLGRVNPCAYFFSFAFSHPAGNCKFKSTPLEFAFQPIRKRNTRKLASYM